MKEITKMTTLEKVSKAPLGTARNPDLKIRKGGWYYDNRGAVWKVILLFKDTAKVCGLYRAGFSMRDEEFTTWTVISEEDRGWLFHNDWYLVDEVEKTPGFDKLKAEWLKDPSWNAEILDFLSRQPSWPKKDWAPCYYLGPKQLCLPHHAKKLEAKRGKHDE